MGCQRIRTKNRRLCVGDLKDVCTIWDRDIKAAKAATAESTHEYTNDLDVFCAIETVNGAEVFDESNQLIGTITHRVYIQFTTRVLSSASTRIQSLGKYLQPLKIQNIDSNSEFIRLDCSEVGVTTKASNR